MKTEKALRLIELTYGTLDEGEVWGRAAATRANTRHVEYPSPSGDSCCMVCGPIEGPDADPTYHPEEFLHDSDEVAKLLAACSVCGRSCLASSAHLHQGMLVGDACCWDERLRATE